uniref:Hexosyltransferase n=1 Tax=Sphaeramia orbicularis TaxID=375764 RepID=A0A672ZU98_9TELE
IAVLVSYPFRTRAFIPPQSVPPTRPEEFLLMPKSARVPARQALSHHYGNLGSCQSEGPDQAIRDTWGGEVEVRGLRVMALLWLGVARERGRSTLSMRDGRAVFCPQAHFMAKVDDDVLFNPSALLHFLNKSRNPYEHGDLYLGRVHIHVAPDRDPDSKHYLPSGAYPASLYPDYCSGTAYVLSRSALLKISLAATASPLSTPLPPEDVFVGLCARTAGVLPSHCPLFSGGPAVPYGRCCYQAMVSIHHIPPREMLHYWADVHSSPPCSWLSIRASLGVCKVRAMLGSVLGLEQGL